MYMFTKVERERQDRGNPGLEIDWFVAGLIRCVQRCLDDIFLLVSGAPLNHQEPQQLPSETALNQVLLFIHLVNACLLPGIVLGCLELSSRKSFVHSARAESVVGGRRIEFFQLPNALQVTTLVLITVSVLWVFVGDITHHAVSGWGK